MADEVDKLRAQVAALQQQAVMQAQEARTQRGIVLGILAQMGLPPHDWEAESLVAAALAERDAELSRLRGEVAALTEERDAYRDKAREWRELWMTCDAKREAAADTWSAHGYRNALVWASQQIVEWPGTVSGRDALYQRIAAGPAQPVEKGERG